jgi:hypothetical protein
MFYWLSEMLMHLLPKELQGEIELRTRICVRPTRDRKQRREQNSDDNLAMLNSVMA